MATLGDSFTPYFYLNLHVIHELGVLIPFTPFEANFLETASVSIFQITPNVWSIIRAFEIICYLSSVVPIVGKVISFYDIEILPIFGWVNLHYLLARDLLEPYVEY